MKKLFVIALAAFGMVACVNEEITELPQGGAITFESAFIDNATRADAVDPSTTTASLAGFDVWAFVNETNGVVFTDQDVTKNSGGAWSYQGTQYWAPNKPYYFAALAPMNSENVTETLATGDAAKLGLGTITFENDYGTEDLLYAKAKVTSKGLNQDNDPVKFQFQHLLSKVKFTFKNGFPTDNVFVVVENVEMTVPQTASINLAQENYSAAWTAHDGTTTLEFGNVAQLGANAAAEVAKERLTIPAGVDQTYAISFDVTLFQGDQPVHTVENMTSTVTGYELAMGYAYNFTAEITPENLNLEAIEFEVEEVEDWVTGAAKDVYPGKTVGVATAAELSAALANPEVTAVVLTEDITLGSNTITRAEGESAVTITKKDFVIDGAGNTLTYEGSNRVIDVRAEDNVIKNVIIKNLTINIASSYCERGINFNNAKGTLLVENVTFEGTAPSYAINFPSSADGVKATIKNSNIVGNIALNVWGENMKIDVIDSYLSNYDPTEVEDYATIKLNSDGSNIAEGTIVNVTGGKVVALNQDDEPVYAAYNATETGVINISETTEVVGTSVCQVAVICFGSSSNFYGCVSFEQAIEKFPQYPNATSIRLTRNIELTNGVEISAGETVVLDLNGKTISAVDNATGSYGLITNKGNLTIQGNGKLTVKATNNRGWSAYSSVISNTVGGNLVVEGGLIEHLGGTDMAYGIDNLTNGKGTSAITTIKGGLIKSTYSAIRQFLNGVEATNELYVKAGAELYSPNRAVFFQDPSKNANTGKLVIEAGAKVTGKVYLSSTAGSTEWPVEVSVAASALTEGSVVAHSEVLPAGYAVVLENGVYTVVEAAAVTTAEELAAAVANKLETIYVSGEIDLANVVLSGYNGTIVGVDNTAVLNTRNFTPGRDEAYQLRSTTLAFKNLTVKVPTEDGDFLQTGFVGFGAIQFDNCAFEGQVTLNGQANWIFNECEFASIENGAYAVFVYGAEKATFNNCSFSGVDRAAKIYGTGGVLDVEYNDCTFTSTTANKYAVNIDATYATTTVALNGCSQTGMPGLYKVDGAKGTVSVN